MNRISSDNEPDLEPDYAPGSGPDHGPGNTRFRRAFAITVGALAALCVLFVALAYLQGPKLESAQFDTDRAIAEPGQLLRLFANQSIAEVSADQVTIEPEVPFTVSTSGEVVAVTFASRLHYDTTYSVAIDGVTSSYSDKPATLSYTFTTGQVPLYYLDRGAGTPETDTPETDTPETGTAEIIRTGVTGTERTVLFAGPRIQSFGMVTDTVIAVVSLTDSDTSTLQLVDTETGLTENVALPGDGTITNLQLSDSGTILAFEFTSAEVSAAQAGTDQADTAQTDTAPDPAYTRALLRLDLDAGRDIEPVLGLDGTPLSVLDFTFAPASTDLVVHTIDSSIVRIGADGAISPLGQFTRMGHLSIDDRVLTVFDQFGALALELDTLETSRLEPSPLDGLAPSGSDVDMLPGGDRVQRVAVFHSDTGRFDSLVVLDDGTTSRVLYQTPKSEGSIDGFRVSPNGQYVAVEAVPNFENSVDDGYAVDRRSTTVQTIIVEVATGAVVRVVDGFDLEW